MYQKANHYNCQNTPQSQYYVSYNTISFFKIVSNMSVILDQSISDYALFVAFFTITANESLRKKLPSLFIYSGTRLRKNSFTRFSAIHFSFYAVWRRRLWLL